MITPVELRQQTFRRVMRGYDPEEVRAFLRSLSEEWEQLNTELRGSREQFEKLLTQYNSMKEVEHILHKTLLQAEQTANDTLENARTKAGLKIKDAEVRAQEIVRRGMDERARIDRDLQELSAKKEEIVMQLTMFLRTQLDRVMAYDRSDMSNLLVESRTGEALANEGLFDPKDLGHSAENTSSNAIFDDIANQL